MTMPSFKSLDLKVVLGIYISYIVIIMVSITVQCMIMITTRPYVNTGSSGQDTVLASTTQIHFGAVSTSRLLPPTLSSDWKLFFECGCTFGGYVLGWCSFS